MLQRRFRGRQQQGAGAGGLQPKQCPLNPRWIDATAAALEQNSALGQTAGGLLQGLHHQIGSGAQARRRQARIQPQMGAVGFIEQDRHSLPLGQRHQRHEITHAALVAR